MKKIRHKFGAIRCEVEGRKFPSKKEASYFRKLNSLKQSGDVLFFLMQVPFHLPGNIVYRMDFMEFWAPKDGEEFGDIIFTEVKGFLTPDAKIKLAQTEELFGIKINIV